jgi:hypothetical protein
MPPAHEVQGPCQQLFQAHGESRLSWFLDDYPIEQPRTYDSARLTDRIGKRADRERRGRQEGRVEQRHRRQKLACRVHSLPGMIERLNDLLRVELATVAGYQKALRTLKNQAVIDTDHILRLASDHQRTVAALQGSVQARGGAPDVAAEPWEGSDAAALTAEGAPTRLEDKEFVAALLEVEKRGLAEYEAALTSLDEDARELVELELIPRQRRHVAGLTAILAHLAV